VGVRAGPVRARARQGALAVALSEDVVDPPTVPYRGIQPFRYVDHAIFLARDEETEGLEDLVAIYRGVLLYGASGDGKSSLINAGLLPATTRRRLHPERVRVQPRAGEEIVIERIAMTEDEGGKHLPSVFAADGDESSRIVVSAQAFEARVREACTSHRPLLVFDQFEEIVTLFEDEDAVAVQRDIVEMLVRLLREPLAVKLLFVFREDYLGKLKYLLADVPELIDQGLRLEPLSADALPTMIRGPFERHPGHFAHELDPELSERVCMLLAKRFGSADLNLSEVETVALRLWQSDDPHTLLQTRGVQGLLEDYLGESLDALSADLRTAAIALLAQMVTSAGTRNVISAEDLVQRVHEEDPDVSTALLHEALERLERESRLIRRERRRDIYLYEITSEFLVPWISLRREEARLVRERRHDELRREQERARERRRYIALGSIAGALFVVAAVIAVLAIWALGQRAEAQRQASDATSLALASSATPLVNSRPDIALLLGLQAYRVKPRVEARSAALAALIAARDPGVVAILHGHAEAVSSVALSSDGHTLASASYDQTIRLWDMRTHKQLGLPLTDHTRYVQALAFSPDGETLASASGDEKTIRLWDARTHEPRGAPITGHTRYVRSMAFSPDGRTLASAGADRTIRLWDVRTHEQRGVPLTGHTQSVMSVAFSRSGNRLASSGSDQTIRLWDVRSHKQLGAPLRDRTKAMAFSPDGRTVASARADSTIQLWDVRTHVRRGAPLSGHAVGVSSLAFSPDGRTLASAGYDHTIRLWDARTSRQRGAPLIGHTDGVLSIGFSRDGRMLASASDDKTIRLWDVQTRNELATPLIGHTSVVHSVTFSPDGRTLASASRDGTIRLWTERTHRQLAGPLTGHASAVRSAVFVADGRTLASAAADKTVRLWDVRTHKQLGAPLTGHTGAINSVASSSDGRTLASASEDKTVRLWDVRTRKQLGAPLRGPTVAVTSVAFSPDGRTLASANDDGTVWLWDVRTHKPLYEPIRDDIGSTLYSVAFSPDGRTLAFAGVGGKVWLWDVRTRKQLGAPLGGIASTVKGVAFSPDGRTLASANEDRTVRLWDVRARKQLGRPLPGHRGGVESVAFSPDGRTLASAGEDNMVRLWGGILWHDVAELQIEVCELVGSGLSRTEWAQYANGIAYGDGCR
jgi:WD40 repeat protein